MNDMHDDNDHPEDELPPIPGLKNLRMEREPGHDLWPAIQARIGQQARCAPPPRVPAVRRRWLPMAAAAAVTAVIAGLIGVRYQLQGPPDQAPTQVAAASAPDSAQADATARIVAMQAPASSSMQGANRALVKANLKIVRSAEDQLRQALATDPDDRYLQSLLLSTQNQKLHLRDLLDRNLI